MSKTIPKHILDDIKCKLADKILTSNKLTNVGKAELLKYLIEIDYTEVRPEDLSKSSWYYRVGGRGYNLLSILLESGSENLEPLFSILHNLTIYSAQASIKFYSTWSDLNARLEELDLCYDLRRHPEFIAWVRK